MSSKPHNERKPAIAITIGDVNGIGPEVTIKALRDSRLLKYITPVIYGSTKTLAYYRKALKAEDFNYSQVKDGKLNIKKVNVVNCWEEMVEINTGQVTKEAGNAAFMALKKAVEDLKSGLIDGVVTAPINKHNIQNEEFAFPGHTEFFTKHFESKESLMLLASDQLRVGVVTGHIPLKDVSTAIGKEKIASKLSIMEHSLKHDFGIAKPKIAVLGLNPHAGEEGLLGSEDDAIIRPVIEDFKKRGKLVYGPFPADGFFGKGDFKKFDGVLAMYHDQGLIPFKTLAFQSGVNYTAGLPIIRTSPDHGTAYNIAGKNEASEESMRHAILMAYDIFKNRQLYLKEE
ncbi:4-hydroxythreonine-4-phosphate dehydrogenase PdxA [Fulvivirga sp. RKSG066]|uniref:4-hydroxythreonine-4-phosphate dehydrogenase PdxA n=1 Tax=Fulvivirga aurantia TaxID=2529383 RepID=UPI0012BCF181|nr:4-hydroxythreonine-4-phosphate dehydrogenase PdxA [Fulvivirga aurantia]MTI20855.1 4-hydroxythreonine-4-phosphate dehydrogenase PdxA [Fulvivirga aurantia]